VAVKARKEEEAEVLPAEDHPKVVNQEEEVKLHPEEDHPGEDLLNRKLEAILVLGAETLEVVDHKGEGEVEEVAEHKVEVVMKVEEEDLGDKVQEEVDPKVVVEMLVEVLGPEDKKVFRQLTGK